MGLRSRVLDKMPPLLRGSLREARRLTLAGARSVGRSRVVRHRGIRIALDERMGEGPIKALREGQYEGGELAAIERFLKRDDVVLEMGTGVGFITLFCARLVGPDRVHSFEANAELEPLIRRNFELNGLHPHLTFAVLGESDGEAEFNLEPEFWSSSRLCRSEQSRLVRVPQLAVNDIIRLVRPTMIIMDIEGGECSLAPLMDLEGVQRIMIELHPYVTGVENAEAVEQHFRGLGFVERWSCPDHMHLLLERSVSG